MLTDDENIIDIQFAVQYNLKNAAEYVFNARKRTTSWRRSPATPSGKSSAAGRWISALDEDAPDRHRNEKRCRRCLIGMAHGVYVQK